MGNIVPTISSGTAGPLGVLHLPRLWQKASLGAVGKLHDDYPAAGAGYDAYVAAQSRALDDLAKTIAEALGALEKAGR